MAESKRDYYEVLGITKTDDQAAIKKAYREKAKMYHPDLHPGDAEAEQKFKEVNEAYSVLSDSDKKAKYDAYGHAVKVASCVGTVQDNRMQMFLKQVFCSCGKCLQKFIQL